MSFSWWVIMWYLFVMEFCSSAKKHKIGSKWMELGNTILSNVTQTLKGMSHILSNIWVLA